MKVVEEIWNETKEVEEEEEDDQKGVRGGRSLLSKKWKERRGIFRRRGRRRSMKIWWKKG